MEIMNFIHFTHGLGISNSTESSKLYAEHFPREWYQTPKCFKTFLRVYLNNMLGSLKKEM